jgi:4-amino-4-deoxy-L-arabinose transferase-like glycosyltransferase
VLPKVVVSILIVAAIVMPWFALVEQRAPGFLGISVANDVIRRTLEPLEQHFGPPGYYLLVLWGIYMPWSVLLPLTFVLAWRHRADARVRFALAAVVGPWVMLELVQTKLPHYLLP